MTAKTDEITREFFNSMLITPRYLDSEIPDISIEMFGRKYNTPVMTAALSHLNNSYANGMTEFALGAKEACALHFMGMGEDKELEDIIATGADTVKIIKPHDSDDEVFRRIEHAVKNGAVAVGMDIDHAVSHDGKYDNVFGLQMHTKTRAQIESYVKAAGVPFVVKGVLSAEDASKCVEAGVAAILVSHHHGMMDSMVPPLMIMPEIVKAVDGCAKILVDCNFESGLDVFKALALGADGVGIGRNLSLYLKDGHEGVRKRIKDISNELKTVMARTGAHSVKEIDPSVIRYRNF